MQAGASGASGAFELAIQTLVATNEDANTATLKDALPELLSCILQARAAAATRTEMTTGVLAVHEPPRFAGVGSVHDVESAVYASVPAPSYA